jgi:lipopolysaccharide/colanic/teichoic acid biosynthesis glycosyltransferase
MTKTAILSTTRQKPAGATGHWLKNPGALLAGFDLIAILLIAAIGIFGISPAPDPAASTGFWGLLAGITVALTFSYGGYRAEVLATPRRGRDIARLSYLAACLAMLMSARLMKRTDLFGGIWVFADIFLTPLVLGGSRHFLARQQARIGSAGLASGPLLICKTYCPSSIARSLAAAGIAGEVSGVLYLNGNRAACGNALCPTIGSTQDLLDRIATKNVRDVIFIEHNGHDPVAEDLRETLLPDLLALRTRIWLAIDLEREFPMIVHSKNGKYRLVPIVSDTLVHAANPGKRMFDLVVASLLFCLCLPLFGLIALLVRCSGPGPVVFRQTRTGAQGNAFTVLKFRTMDVNPQDDGAQATENDARVTRIGRFLRRTSLDEMIQLLNVIKGDMSLVGPRPHAPETRIQGLYFENAVRFYRGRYRVKPGITGLAQIRGQRGETKRLEKL